MGQYEQPIFINNGDITTVQSTLALKAQSKLHLSRL